MLSKTLLIRLRAPLNYRLGLSSNYHSFSKAASSTYKKDIEQKRQFSVESAIRAQTGIFKTLSESTPVEYIQKFLVSVHDYSGLPWWASIICSTILLRGIVTLPLALYQNYIIAKLENLKLEMNDLVKELKFETSMAVKMYNWDERTARITYNRSVKKHWNDLIVRENCHPFKASLLLWFQIPLWISFSIGLRNLVYMLPKADLSAHLTYTELTLGGFAWIPNLTEVDSSFLFPISLGLLNLAIIELQVLSKTNEPSKFQRVMTNFFRGFSILMVPISASVPSCLVLYWTTSSAFGLIQNLVLLSPKVKRLCRIPKTQSEIEKPYQHVLSRLQKRFS